MMSRKPNIKITDIKLLALSLMLLISVMYSHFSLANEPIAEETFSSSSFDETAFMEIEILPVLTQEENQSNFIYANPEVSTYENESIKKEDILRTIPSITTENDKTLGLLIPPFAYFAQRF